MMILLGGPYKHGLGVTPTFIQLLMSIAGTHSVIPALGGLEGGRKEQAVTAVWAVWREIWLRDIHVKVLRVLLFKGLLPRVHSGQPWGC